jgi:hypothetical protein
LRCGAAEYNRCSRSLCCGRGATPSEREALVAAWNIVGTVVGGSSEYAEAPVVTAELRHVPDGHGPMTPTLFAIGAVILVLKYPVICESQGCRASASIVNADDTVMPCLV